MTLHVSRKNQPLRDSDILPYDDGVPMETMQHRRQMNLLIDTLKPYLAEQGVKAYVAGNNFLYYQKGKPPKFCGPDFYVVLGREDVGQLSYVVWEEDNRFPDVIIELISESTESVDRGAKFIRYRDLFKTREYFLYNPLSKELEGYRLEADRYLAINPTNGIFSCQALDLSLAVRGSWLRWQRRDGAILPTGDELAEEERERAEEERERAEEERERAEKERERAQRAEEEVARLRAELEAVRRSSL
jgi:Uma2 family endonuclease